MQGRQGSLQINKKGTTEEICTKCRNDLGKNLLKKGARNQAKNFASKGENNYAKNEQERYRGTRTKV